MQWSIRSEADKLGPFEQLDPQLGVDEKVDYMCETFRGQSERIQSNQPKRIRQEGFINLVDFLYNFKI